MTTSEEPRWDVEKSIRSWKWRLLLPASLVLVNVAAGIRAYRELGLKQALVYVFLGAAAVGLIEFVRRHIKWLRAHQAKMRELDAQYKRLLDERASLEFTSVTWKPSEHKEIH